MAEEKKYLDGTGLTNILQKNKAATIEAIENADVPILDNYSFIGFNTQKTTKATSITGIKSVTSSNTSVCTATFLGDSITVDVKAGSGTARITVTTNGNDIYASMNATITVVCDPSAITFSDDSSDGEIDAILTGLDNGVIRPSDLCWAVGDKRIGATYNRNVLIIDTDYYNMVGGGKSKYVFGVDNLGSNTYNMSTVTRYTNVTYPTSDIHEHYAAEGGAMYTTITAPLINHIKRFYAPIYNVVTSSIENVPTKMTIPAAAEIHRSSAAAAKERAVITKQFAITAQSPWYKNTPIKNWNNAWTRTQSTTPYTPSGGSTCYMKFYYMASSTTNKLVDQFAKSGNTYSGAPIMCV